MEKKVKEYEFVWRIKNFNSNLPKIGNDILDMKCFASPNFTFYVYGYTQWYLELYPKTGRNGNYVKCLPICMDYSKDSTVDCELSILAEDNSVFATKQMKCRCSAVFHCDFSNALEFERSKLPLQTDLLFRCKLSYKVNEKEQLKNASDIEDLSKNMMNLYHSRYLSDLTLCVGSDKLFVHRTVICIRAPKLAEVLEIQELEHFDPVVNVTKLSFAALKVLVQYFYSGEMEVSSEILPELYQAAIDYQLNPLKFEFLCEESFSKAVTEIQLIKKSFDWKIPSFISLKKKISRLIDLQLSGFIISITPSTSDFQLSFKITSFPESKQVYLKCNISVIDSSGSETLSASHNYFFESDQLTKKIGVVSKETWNFPTLLKKKDLIANKSKYLPKDGSLHLYLQLEITEGNKTNQIIGKKNSLKSQNLKISHLEYLSDSFLDIFKVKNRPFVGGDYYEDDCYNDVVLEVDKKEIHCHKSVLCARSPMFTKLLKHAPRNRPEKLQISDVDYDTLLLMIQFIYSGHLTNTAAMENAKLHLAAVKYEVHSLTKKCNSLLNETVTLRNFSDILMFAEEHDNEGMKRSVYEYIKTHKSDVLDSEEWKVFVEKYPVLSSTVFANVVERQNRPRQFYNPSQRRRGFRVSK